MREQFIEKRFNRASQVIISRANEVLSDYFAQGFTMTLRQLHYQFVARKIVISPDDSEFEEIYENTHKNYKRLGNIMSEARLAGLVDWDTMEDRVRELDRSPRWDSPSDIVEAIADQYKEDAWEGQKWRPEIWIEKDALAGVIERVCRELRIDFFACRGYVSQSAQYEASKRFLRYKRRDQKPIIFHFGDHDPSGLDMTRENRAKFELLTGERIELKRLALNYDQVQKYNPPPNFAKLTDSRAADYVAQYGDESWELDALEPSVIDQLIRDNVEPLIDRRAWNAAMKREKTNQEKIQAVSDRWEDVVEFIS